MRVPKFFTPCPQKLDFGPKRAKFGPKLAFWAKYRHFWPIWSNAWPKTMRTSCLSGFCYVGTKTFTYSHKNLDFWPKNGQIWSKICIFGHFGPNIAIFCTFCPIPDQNTIWTRCLGGFFIMWVTKLLISPVKKRIFLPKIGIFGQFWPGHAGLFSALLVGRLVVVGARGWYLARHLFTLYFTLFFLNIWNIS